MLLFSHNPSFFQSSFLQALDHDMLETLLPWCPADSETPGEMYLAGCVQEGLDTPTCSLSQVQVCPVPVRFVPAAVRHEARELVRIRVVRERGGFCSRPLHRTASDLQPADDGAAMVGGDRLHDTGTAHRRHSAARRLPGRHHRKGLVSHPYDKISTCMRHFCPKQKPHRFQKGFCWCFDRIVIIYFV